MIEREGGAELVSAAADRNQATIVFDATKTMIENNPKLSSRCKIHKKAITFPNSGSYKYLSSESYSKHGMNISCAVIDELHAIENPDLIHVITTSIGARAQPLIIYISTADFCRPGIYADTYKRAKQCQVATNPQDVGYDEHFLPVIYEAKNDDDWTDPKIWALANPNLGISIQQDYLEAECRKAIDTSSMENVFKRLHLNIQTEADQRWISSKEWDANAGLPFDVNSLLGQKCYGGLDLSTSQDLTCYGLFFPDSGVLLQHYFAPLDNAKKKERLDKVPYSLWAKQGWLTLTEGNVIDYDFVKKHIVDMHSKYEIIESAYDPYNATQIALQLVNMGIKMIEHRQGSMSMNEPSKDFERRVLKHELRHLNNPVLKWMIGNTNIKLDSGENILPSKAKSSGRIDGVIVAIMCLARYILGSEFKSVYSNQEVLFVDYDQE